MQVRLTDEEHRELARAAGGPRKLQEYLRNLIIEQLAAESQVAAGPIKPRSPKFQPLIDLFFNVLDSGDGEAVKAIERTLLIFQRLRRPDPPAKVRGRAS